MPQTKKPRRVRMVSCDRCGTSFNWQRRLPGEAIPLQTCPHCYTNQDGREMKAWLVKPPTKP